MRPLYLLLLPWHLVAAQAQDLVRVCGHDLPWPPYFYPRPHSPASAAQVQGYSVAVLERITRDLGLQARIDLLPWTRCLSELRRGHYDLAMDATLTPERKRDFLISRAYYVTHAHYYYNRQKYPQGLPIHALRDLRNHQVCGIYGLSYARYGLDAAQIDSGAKNYQVLFEKLHMGRCDLFLLSAEVMGGYRDTEPSIAAYLLAPWVAQKPVPELAPATFHMLFSRSSPRGSKLHTRFEQALESLERSGELSRLQPHPAK